MTAYDCYAITTISLILTVGVPQTHPLPKAYGSRDIGRTWVDLGVSDAHSTGSATRGSNLFELSTRDPFGPGATMRPSPN